MKEKVKHICGHFGEIHSLMPLTFAERKRYSGWPCPQCAGKIGKPNATRPERKIRRVKDDDLARDILGDA